MLWIFESHQIESAGHEDPAKSISNCGNPRCRQCILWHSILTNGYIHKEHHNALRTCFCLGAVSSEFVAFLMWIVNSCSALSLSTGLVGRWTSSPSMLYWGVLDLKKVGIGLWVRRYMEREGWHNYILTAACRYNIRNNRKQQVIPLSRLRGLNEI